MVEVLVMENMIMTPSEQVLEEIWSRFDAISDPREWKRWNPSPALEDYLKAYEHPSGMILLCVKDKKEYALWLGMNLVDTVVREDYGTSGESVNCKIRVAEFKAKTLKEFSGRDWDDLAVSSEYIRATTLFECEEEMKSAMAFGKKKSVARFEKVYAIFYFHENEFRRSIEQAAEDRLRGLLEAYDSGKFVD